jgi:hypothetical protein
MKYSGPTSGWKYLAEGYEQSKFFGGMGVAQWFTSRERALEVLKECGQGTFKIEEQIVQ